MIFRLAARRNHANWIPSKCFRMLPTRYLTSVMFRRGISKNCVARPPLWQLKIRAILGTSSGRRMRGRMNATQNRAVSFYNFSNARPFEIREKPCCTVVRLNRSLHLTARRSSRPLNVPFSGLTFAAPYETCSTLRLISRIIIGDISDIKDKFYGPGPRTGTGAFAF